MSWSGVLREHCRPAPIRPRSTARARLRDQDVHPGAVVVGRPQVIQLGVGDHLARQRELRVLHQVAADHPALVADADRAVAARQHQQLRVAHARRRRSPPAAPASRRGASSRRRGAPASARSAPTAPRWPRARRSDDRAARRSPPRPAARARTSRRSASAPSSAPGDTGTRGRTAPGSRRRPRGDRGWARRGASTAASTRRRSATGSPTAGLSKSSGVGIVHQPVQACEVPPSPRTQCWFQ